MSVWRSPSRSGRRRGLVLAAIGMLAASIGMAVVLAVRLHDDVEANAGTRRADDAADAGAGPADAGPSRQQSAADGAVALPAPAGQVDGYPVGFPRDELGAVAAAVAVSRAQIGFDYAQAAAVAALYTAGADEKMVAIRARDAVAARRQRLGVPATGPAPAPAAFALTPFAFTARRLHTDYYAVTVLNLATTTNTNGEVRTFYYSGTQLLHWITDDTGDDTGGDWKLVAGTTADQHVVASLPELPAVPPTHPRFEASGWAKFTLTDPASPRMEARP